MLRRTLSYLIIISFVFQPFISTSQATTANPYSGSGDWVLNTGESISNVQLNITGNVIINTTSTVTFTNVTIFLAGTLIIEQGAHSFINSTIISSSGTVIQLRTDTNEFINNTISGTSNSAIYISSSSNNRFIGNNITVSGNSSIAIELVSSNRNQFINNKILTDGNGYSLTSSNDNVIINNEIISNQTSIIPDNYLYSEFSSRNNTLSNSQLISNTTSNIRLSSVSSSFIIYNYLNSNASYGISIDLSDNVQIKNNEVVNNKNIALNLENTNNIDITNNIFNSVVTGIWITSDNGSRIENNDITAASKGITGTGNDYVVINNNIINAPRGIILNSTQFAEVMTNTITNQNVAIYGLLFTNSIINSNLINSSNLAIDLLTSNSNTISNNKLYNNSIAIRLINAKTNSIENNTITGIQGIELSINSNLNTIQNNTILTQQLGMSLSNSKTNNITNNQIHANNTGGISFTDFSDNSLLSRNNIIGNYISSINGMGMQFETLDKDVKNAANVENNTIYSINNYGVYMSRAVRATAFINNTILSMNSIALYSDGGGNQNYFNNTIISDQDTSVYLHLANFANFRYNLIQSNSSNGIEIINTKNSLFTSNTIISPQVAITVGEKPLFINVAVGNNQFLNNMITGDLVNLTEFSLITDLNNKTVGDLIQFNSTVPLFYQIDDLDEQQMENNELIYEFPGAQVLSVWSSNTYGDKFLKVYQINVSKELTAPTIVSLNTTTVVNEDLEYLLIWNVADNAAPDTYTIIIDGNIAESGDWRGLDQIIYTIPQLGLGVHVFILEIFDTSGNKASSSVEITIVDITDPKVVEYEPTIRFNLDQPDKILTWKVTDNHPGNYAIYSDGVNKINGTWKSGEAITWKLRGYQPGNYSIKILIFDSSLNNITLTTLVEVFEITPPKPAATTQETTTTQPTEEGPDLLFWIPMGILGLIGVAIVILVRKNKV